MPIQVRTATVEDLDALALLNEPVQRLHARMYPGDFKADADPAEVKKFFQARMAASADTIVIAETERGPVGYLWFELRARPESAFKPAHRCIYIHQISVLPNTRRQGVGTVLLRFVEEQALFHRISEINLDTWAANRGVRRFFSARGFKIFNVVLRRPVKIA